MFNVYSMPGMVFVQSTHVTPVAFLMGIAAFSSMDHTLEEGAAAAGGRPFRVFRTVTLPLMRPALAGALLLMFVQTISTFEVPQMLGLSAHKLVLATKIYSALETFPPDYGTVGVIGFVTLAIAGAGVYVAHRLGRATGRATITGKGHRATVTQLGATRWLCFLCVCIFFIVTAVLPLAMLIWSSLLPTYEAPSVGALRRLTSHNYHAILSTPDLLQSLEHSLATAAVAALAVTALCLVIAYISIKTDVPGRGILDFLATAPIAVPSIIMGVAVLYWYLVVPGPIHLYGTLAILVVAFVTIALPYGIRYLSPGMSQISRELEEAATASGAAWRRVMLRVYLPLLSQSIVAAFLYSFIVAFREISAPIFLYTQQTQVVSVKIYNLWVSGEFTIVSALGVVMVAVLAVAVLVVGLASRHLGVRPT